MPSFHEIIRANKPVLVDFSAEWCGPCKMMKPILAELKTRVGDRATLLKVDVDQNQQAAADYQIRSVPTLILFKQGKICWRKSGVVQAAELERMINETLTT